MKTTNYSLNELLERSREGSLTIPQFQRKFIWRESQVKKLVDSIARAYPVGSLLIMDEKAGISLASRKIEANFSEDESGIGDRPDDSQAQSDTKSYILDGQQRTTSIARVFLNSHEKKVFYFDLKKMHDMHKTEDTSWIRTFRKGKINPKYKMNGRYLRADVVLKQVESDVYLSTYVSESDDFSRFQEDKSKLWEAIARIKGFFETIRNYKIPVITLDNDSGIESICRVFETINSTGTRLTTFDLAVARFFPDPDLRSLYEEALDENRILRSFDVDGERILQVFYLAKAGREGKYADPTRSNLLSLDRHEMKAEWGRSAQALAETYKWAREQGARPQTLPSHNALVALAAIRSLKLTDVTGQLWKDNEFIRRWYFSKIMQAGASQAANYKIGQDFISLRQYVEHDKTPDVTEVLFNEDTLLDLRPTDVRYKSLLNIFARTIHEDIISGNIIDSEASIHDHHIFPRVLAKRKILPAKELDGICNRMPVLEKTNLSLSDSEPEKYFSKLVHDAKNNGTMKGVESRLKNCMIPGDPYDPDWPGSFAIERFDEFCRKRAELMVARVGEVVGESLRRAPLSDDEPLEDD